MPRCKRAGFSMIEMIFALVVMALLATLGFPRIRDAVQKQNVRSARVAGAALVVKARMAAVQRGCRATVHVRNDGRIWVTACRTTGAGLDTLGGVDNLVQRYGVAVAASRDSVPFGPRGITLGNWSTTVRVSNSMANDSVMVNAVGKVVR